MRFFIAMAIGAAAAMFYGWKINPVHYTVTTPDTLRIDYKTDYVLMVAEAYHTEGDPDLAARRLALIGSDDPVKVVTNALQDAKRIPYPAADQELIQALEQTLKKWSPVPGKAAP
jgi:hypothetical protein